MTDHWESAADADPIDRVSAAISRDQDRMNVSDDVNRINKQPGRPVVPSRPDDPSQQRAGLDLESHLVLLVLALVIVVLSSVLNLRNGQRVVLPGVNIALPNLCAFQRLVGHDCPGCGLTRSFVSLADGDVTTAWSYNAVGPLLFAVIVFQIPYRTIQIWRRSRGLSTRGWCRESWVMWFFVITMVAQWLSRSIGPWVR